MIAHTFQEAFSAQWIKANLKNLTHDLVLLHRLIPWQPIIDRLTPLYHPDKGRNGQSLRTTVAVSIVARLRQLSDEKVIEQVKENRYMQYFCNVPDQGLQTFMDPSTLCRFRKRLGISGTAIIEAEVFDHLKNAHAIEADMMLQDSTVLESPIIYPTDVRLLYKAFDKMACIAKKAGLEPWWDQGEIKKLWRAYNLDGSKPLAYLCALYLWFEPALETFAAHQRDLPEGPLHTQAHELLEALLILDEQTQLKLEGEIREQLLRGAVLARALKQWLLEGVRQSLAEGGVHAQFAARRGAPAKSDRGGGAIRVERAVFHQQDFDLLKLLHRSRSAAG